MSLIEAFADPLGYLAQRAGSIVAGSVSQVANGIDEFVTGALRNNRPHVKALMQRMGMEALYRRPGRRVRRAPVADDQVRGGLPARLRERQKELTASSHRVNPLHVNQSSGVDMRRSRRTTASLCASSRAA